MTTHARFAPSPTGKLHVGNLRTAILTWLFAKKTKGEFTLRLDDTDAERSSEDYANAIIEDLTWLGMGWDNSFKQSDRDDRYEEVLENLRKSGRIYACYETAEELALKRKTQLNRGLPPVYDRESLNLTDDQKAKYEAEGRKAHWRFKLIDGEIKWHDHIRGPQSFQSTALSDPVLVREDGRPLFTLTSVVDDSDKKTTHILRGEDHVTNTAVQIQLFEAIGDHVPEFGHMPLITDKDGKGLSKRLGSLSIEHLRKEGFEPLAVMAFLAKLGTSDPIQEKESIDHLIEEFDLSKISRATPKFDLEELERLNAKFIRGFSFEKIEKRLAEHNYHHITADFWESVKANLSNLHDIQEWWEMAKMEIEPEIEDAEFLTKASTLLPTEPWTTETWGAWVDALKAETDRKGKMLFMPLRKALTGKPHGPELKNLLPLIGREKALARLQGKRA
jgi:glutamyl-tRNA synthetase